MEISATQIKELREATGAGVLECRKALEQANGDMDKAARYPQGKRAGQGRQESRAHRSKTAASKSMRIPATASA